jgi:hypothetical protein
MTNEMLLKNDTIRFELIKVKQGISIIYLTPSKFMRPVQIFLPHH